MPATVNLVSITSKIQNQLKKRQYIGLMKNAANTRFVFAKSDALKEYDSHDAVKELLQDPSIDSSEFLDRGSLPSFLGMPDASLEVGKLRNFLETNITMGGADKVKISTSKDKINYSFPVYTPSKNEIEQNFPVPDGFSSKSWPRIIEEGIGAGASAIYYIFFSKFFSKSRSGYGLQGEHKRKSGGAFKPKVFLTGILNKFRAKFGK